MTPYRAAGFFEPMPNLQGLPRGAVYSARGMEGNPENLMDPFNDHTFACPRELCSPYFTDVVDEYEQCERARPLMYRVTRLFLVDGTG
jgi:hypothetical protein